MTPAQARLLLETLRDHVDRLGGDANAAGHVLARLPQSKPGEARKAREELERAGALMRGGFLTALGRSLAYRVGAAVHNGWPITPAPRLEDFL